jgi:general nucleoside transport system permease protein
MESHKVSAASSFLESAVRTATPLLYAALGELVVERSGMINIGLEGLVIGGAFGALVGATHGGIVAGFACAAAVGVALAVLFYVFVDVLDADQIVIGTAITILALGATGALYRVWYGSTGAALSIATIAPVRIPGAAAIPLVGAALFNQPATTYVLYALVPATWLWMFRTRSGLALRALGESPDAAVVSGVSLSRYRLGALCFSGVLAGLAGATLVLAQVGTFAEGMSAGRGFVAIAVVVLGRWNPLGVAAAALVFGAASALQYWVQALGLPIPYQVVLALPYLLTLAALAGVAGRVKAPAALGRPLARSVSS